MAARPSEGGDANAPLLGRFILGSELTPRHAARLIAASSLALTLAGGLAGWLFDRDDFAGLGDSLWWALQTVTTVGYGDVVPKDTVGRLIAAVLMLNGIALISVITGAITAALVEQARRRQVAEEDGSAAALARIEARLAKIEGAVEGRRSGE
jgi:voltage-gated potassium channel